MRKRPLDNSFAPFASKRDFEMCEIERNILARVVYKSTSQFKRNEILSRLKVVVKFVDLLILQKDSNLIPNVSRTVKIASERFFQQLSMGLMIPMSLVCVASLGRLFEILSRATVPILMDDDGPDDGVPVDRIF